MRVECRPRSPLELENKAFMYIPSDKKSLIKLAKDTIEICSHSMGQRQAMYRQYRQWIETGRSNGQKSLNNRLYSHEDRLASHLFSPADLRFLIDYENHYPKDVLAQAEMASRVLTREWERNDIDITFASGVKVALDYGCCIAKALARKGFDDEGNIMLKKIDARIVNPWHFGVYDENETSLSEQEAVLEIAYLTLPQVWRRVAHLPDAEKLYRRIRANATANTGSDGVDSFFHQVLSTTQLQTDITNMTTPLPGGIVSLANNASDVIIDADRGAEVVKFYELWLWDDIADDWVTVQMFDPDILIAPLYKKSNLYCPDTLPYGVIRPNESPGYFWGRSEIIDLTEPQGLLTTTLDDIRRLMGLQFDKLLAFTGQNGITDEIYDNFRQAGYINLEQGSSVNDLTPKLPTEAFIYIEMIMKNMDEIGGFGNILSGQGEQGVRAGNHASMLMKTASPRLRDRSILVERQCAAFADSILAGLEAKNNKLYWIDPAEKIEKEFYLSQLPEDRRVSVDSHSSSPIYEDDHKALVGELAKLGVIDGNSILDLLSVPMRDMLKQRYKEKVENEQKMIAEHPELLTHGKKKHS